jgi:hypothetical protein
MPDTPSQQDGSRGSAAERGIRWDAVAAIIASLVGLLALVVAGYTAYIQRQQVRAQVWPFLLEGYSGVASDYFWVNKGVGPALVNSVQVYVGGKPRHDWNDVFGAFRMDGVPYGQSTLDGNVFSAGETLQWITFKDHADYERFNAAAQRMNMHVRVCYCSTLGECWMDDATLRRGDKRTPVGQCRPIPAAEQFHD